jgi:hypothetical protein
VGNVIWFAARASDPPVPDFNYDEAVEVTPATYPFDREAAPEPMRALFTAAELIERIHAAYDAMGEIHAKILGARVDDATQALQTQKEAYQTGASDR